MSDKPVIEMPSWDIDWRVWPLACFVCYGLGIFNERLWPGERGWPMGIGEAAIWGLLLMVMFAPLLIAGRFSD